MTTQRKKATRLILAISLATGVVLAAAPARAQQAAPAKPNIVII